MAVIYPHFLRTILTVYDNLHNQIPYPFFDSACIRYEALRSIMVEGTSIQTVIEKYGLTEYTYRKSFSTFQHYGTPGLIGIDSQQLTEELSVEVERMAFIMKRARPWILATKVVLILKGFHYDVSLPVMRHLYASYGWALGTKPYQYVDFLSLNFKVIQLCKFHSQPLARKSFFDKKDRLQGLLEVSRTMESRGITRRHVGSRVSFEQHKKNFLSLGLLGLVARARSAFRNSKLGFTEKGRIILSKIQKPERNEAYYLKILSSKNIQVAPTCITNIFTRWNVSQFQSQFKGDLQRLFEPEKEEESYGLPIKDLPTARSIRLDLGFISFVKDLAQQSTPLANPGFLCFYSIWAKYLEEFALYRKPVELMNSVSLSWQAWCPCLPRTLY